MPNNKKGIILYAKNRTIRKTGISIIMHRVQTMRFIARARYGALTCVVLSRVLS